MNGSRPCSKVGADVTEGFSAKPSLIRNAGVVGGITNGSSTCTSPKQHISSRSFPLLIVESSRLFSVLLKRLLFYLHEAFFHPPIV